MKNEPHIKIQGEAMEAGRLVKTIEAYEEVEEKTEETLKKLEETKAKLKKTLANIDDYVQKIRQDQD